MWTEFVQLSRCKRRKRELACNFANRKLLCIAWRGWSQYILAKRGKKEMEVHVKQWSITRMKRYISLVRLYLLYMPTEVSLFMSNMHIIVISREG